MGARTEKALDIGGDIAIVFSMITAGPVILLIEAVEWAIEQFKGPTTEELIERDYAATKHRMNDIAGQSWRNLAG